MLAAQNTSIAIASTGMSSSVEAALTLPDAPGEPVDSPARSLSGSSDQASFSNAPTTGAMGFLADLLNSHSRLVVPAGQKVQPLAANEKVTLGMKAPFSLFAVTGWLASSGYSQWRNSTPNYGVDKGAYGERLGATALRNLTEDVFGNAVLAPILHEDPRYFVMGSSHNFFKRGLYAATRVLITRDDDGHSTPNYSLIGGNLAGAALTNAYYPPTNRGFTQTAMTFGTSLGGSAIGFAISEFYGDALKAVHLKKAE